MEARIHRALSQRLSLGAVVGDACVVNGLTGAYRVALDRRASTFTCECRDFELGRSSGRLCKHVYFVLLRVLKVGKSQLRRAGVPRRLPAFPAPAPPPVRDLSLDDSCCICLAEWDQADQTADSANLIWCTQCGHRVHRACALGWWATAMRNHCSCPFCRGTHFA